jgi:hypothetical protein
MGRRRVSHIHSLMELWSAWCEGSTGQLGAGSSMLARLIDGKGEILFGNSGPGSSEPNDGIETRIERIVMALAQRNQDCADVLRLEFSAGWWGVCARRGIRNYDPRGMDQMKRAHMMGISLRTYERRLQEAMTTIEAQLKEKP